MQVTVPVAYSVTAIKFKHQLESNLTMMENLTVDIQDVDAESLDFAMVVSDLEGRELERVYGYNGKFWIRDSRGEGDMPFLSQHLDLVGQNISKRSGGYDVFSSSGQYRSAIEARLSKVGEVGLLRYATGDLSDHLYREHAYNGRGGVEFLEKTVESERARNVTVSNREVKLANARLAAHTGCIAVDGVNYRRVSEPCLLVATAYDYSAKWMFGAPNFVDTSSSNRQTSGYPVSMRDFGRLHEWFPSRRDRALNVDFVVEVMDESYFTRPADRIGILADATNIVESSLGKGESTPFIHKWCEVRDMLVDMWKVDGGRATTQQVLEIDESEYEKLAGLVEEIAQLGDVPDRGLRMWDSRVVTVPKSNLPGLGL